MDSLRKYAWFPRFLKKRLKIRLRHLLSLLRGRTYWQVEGIKLGFVTPHHHEVAWEQAVLGSEVSAIPEWTEAAKNSSLIYDIGGYNGIYGLAAALANPKAQVVIFEVDRINYEQCLFNIKLNGLEDRVEVRRVAISSKDGYVRFKTQGMTGGRIGEGEEEVRSVALDSLPTPDLMKLDIEGAETDALIHAPKTLSYKPTIVLELHRWAENKEEMWKALVNYSVRKIGRNEDLYLLE